MVWQTTLDDRVKALLSLINREVRVTGVCADHPGPTGQVEVTVSGYMHPPAGIDWLEYIPKDPKPLVGAGDYVAARRALTHAFGALVAELLEAGCVVLEERISLNHQGRIAEVLLKVWPPDEAGTWVR